MITVSCPYCHKSMEKVVLRRPDPNTKAGYALPKDVKMVKRSCWVCSCTASVAE